MREHMKMATSDERFVTGLIVSLSGLGLLLAAVGLYGLTAFLVGRRTQEIGIRVALGAQRSSIFAMVLRYALVLTAAGVAVGAIAAVPATSVLRAFLFGVAPHDVGAFLIAVAVLAVVACGAALLPALRATKVDPMVALHYE
jgi:ABC-type antimicrobial peptide transport system permease subunit